MQFIKIYNDDLTYNSLLNTRYIFKINDKSVTANSKTNDKYYQIEYYLGYRVEYALITEKDYLELTLNNSPAESTTEKAKTNKTIKKEKVEE